MNPLLYETGDGIRRFSDAAIQDQLDRAIANLPDDATAMAVGHATQEGAKASLVINTGKGWSVAVAAYEDLVDPGFRPDWSLSVRKVWRRKPK